MGIDGIRHFLRNPWRIFINPLLSVPKSHRGFPFSSRGVFITFKEEKCKGTFFLALFLQKFKLVWCKLKMPLCAPQKKNGPWCMNYLSKSCKQLILSLWEPYLQLPWRNAPSNAQFRKPTQPAKLPRMKSRLPFSGPALSYNKKCLISTSIGAAVDPN